MRYRQATFPKQTHDVWRGSCVYQFDFMVFQGSDTGNATYSQSAQRTTLHRASHTQTAPETKKFVDVNNFCLEICRPDMQKKADHCKVTLHSQVSQQKYS